MVTKLLAHQTRDVAPDFTWTAKKKWGPNLSWTPLTLWDNLPVHQEYDSDFKIQLWIWFLIMFKYQTSRKFLVLWLMYIECHLRFLLGVTFFYMLEPTWLHIISNWGSHLFHTGIFSLLRLFHISSISLWVLFHREYEKWKIYFYLEIWNIVSINCNAES